MAGRAGSPRRGRPTLGRARHAAIRCGNGRTEDSREPRPRRGSRGTRGGRRGAAGRRWPCASSSAWPPWSTTPGGLALLRRAVCRPAARDDGAATAAAGDQAGADGALRRLGHRPGRDPRRGRGVRRRRRTTWAWTSSAATWCSRPRAPPACRPCWCRTGGHRGDDRPRLRPVRRPGSRPGCWPDILATAAGRRPSSPPAATS